MAKAGKAKSSVSKAAFVRSLPADLSAAEVIKRAKEKGITLSPAYVYVIRSKGNEKGGGKGTIGKGAGKGSQAEREFVRLALDLGFSRAQEILNQARARIVAAMR